MSTSRTVICLLRNDLRLHDNELFHWAQRNAEYIVPLYCFDPRHYVGTYNYNLPKTGPFRLHFLLEGVKDLRNTMLSKGSNLVVRRGKPEEVVADLIKRLGSVSTVAFHEEVTSEELSVEKRVKDVCSRMKVKVHTCWGSTLYHRDDVPFHHISRLPDVYTQFRKAVETQSRVRPLFPTPEQLKPLPDGLEEGAIPTAEDGDYVRRWVPELQGIRGADVHAPWTLSTASLSHAGVSLGETYPNPVVVAPEWSRHVNKKPSGARPSPRGKKGPSHTPKQHGDRGIDFYFSRSKNL